jgi:ribosome-associated toxin RatA of RatAB toxin-antitoxin module
MKTIHKSVLIWYSPTEMYTLVSDVNQYPQFLV